MNKRQQRLEYRSNIVKRHNGYEGLVEKLNIKTFVMSRTHLAEIGNTDMFSLKFSKSTSVDELVTVVGEFSKEVQETLKNLSITKEEPTLEEEEVHAPDVVWGDVVVLDQASMHFQFTGQNLDKELVKSLDRMLTIKGNDYKFLVILPIDIETGKRMESAEELESSNQFFVELGYQVITKDDKTFYVKPVEKEEIKVIEKRPRKNK